MEQIKPAIVIPAVPRIPVPPVVPAILEPYQPTVPVPPVVPPPTP